MAPLFDLSGGGATPGGSFADPYTPDDGVVNFVGGVEMTGPLVVSSSVMLGTTPSDSATFAGGMKVARYLVTGSTYNVAATDYYLGCTYTSLGTVTVTLPSASLASNGRVYHVKDEGGLAGTNNVTIRTMSGSIDGAATLLIDANYNAFTIMCNGFDYFVF